VGRARLIELEWPEFGQTAELPDWRASEVEYAQRLAMVDEVMEQAGLTHLAVYGDREHFGNLAWLAGFDPRFEEAVLLKRRGEQALLLAGNECMGYVQASPAVSGGLVSVERFQDFSLTDQPRGDSRALEIILRDEGIEAHSKVGVAGWKEYGSPQQIDAPSYFVDALRFAAGWENVVNAAGRIRELREVATVGEIAYFEWTNTLASEGMKRVIRAVRPGALDYELLEEARYCGVPLGCHMTLKCGANRVSLASARGERVVRGGRFSCGISYWGANCCRCGWVAAGPEDLPAEARGYLEEFAGPYFEAMSAWFESLHIGAEGSELEAAVHSRLPWDKFHVFLNAGHLIHLEEWLGAPARLKSGMVMQADVIPSNPVFYSSRMEDGYVLADSALQAELKGRFPALLARAEARRDFMRESLGLPLHDDVLPLSNLCGIVPPFLLQPELAFALT